jgi:uridine kinase
MVCNCRKPATGMIDQACSEMPILRKDSWLVGDTTTDLLTARRAGLRSVLVRTGYAGCDDKYPIRPDHIAPDLAAAVDFILDVYPQLTGPATSIASNIANRQVIAITGLAHSGKSSFASVLEETLIRQGRHAVVISLDGYIVEEKLRGDDFNSRHDLVSILELFERIKSERHADLLLEIPHYNRLRRGPSPKRESVILLPDTVVILEGVAIAKIPGICTKADKVIWVAADEAVRKERFIKDYAWRGIRPADAEALWEKRLIEESFSPPPHAETVTL